MTSNRVLAFAAGIGVVAGLRSMTAPAAVCQAGLQRKLRLSHTGLHYLNTPAAANLTAALAVGEIVTDKLSFTPNRTDPGPLGARIVSGAVCGAALSASARRPLAGGAVAGPQPH